jgi:hypothetical protein
MKIDDIRSLKWSDFFIYALTDPGQMHRIIQRNDPAPFALSFTVPAVVALVDILSYNLLLSETTPYFYYKISYGWILAFLTASFKALVASSLMDFLSQAMGNAGRIKETVAIVNFSLMPGILMLPLMVVVAITDFAPLFFYFLFSLGLFVWSVYIAVRCLAEMHGVTPGRSLVIYAFPYVLTGVVVFFALVLAVASTVGFISSVAQ